LRWEIGPASAALLTIIALLAVGTGPLARSARLTIRETATGFATTGASYAEIRKSETALADNLVNGLAGAEHRCEMACEPNDAAACPRIKN
jgi:hypothetical protein